MTILMLTYLSIGKSESKFLTSCGLLEKTYGSNLSGVGAWEMLGFKIWSISEMLNFLGGGCGGPNVRLFWLLLL